MFGGVGIYAGQLFFALIADDTLYFKVDDSNRPEFERLGMRPFQPYGEGGEVMQYYQVPTELLEDPEALRTFADSVLAPLDRYDEGHGGDLVDSLRRFLERNARWEAAAKDLYVHRHTLRYRMRKVEELTGRRLSSARDRMEFFLALRARDLLLPGSLKSGFPGLES